MQKSKKNKKEWDEDAAHMAELREKCKFEEKNYIDHLDFMMEEQAAKRKEARTQHNIEV